MTPAIQRLHHEAQKKFKQTCHVHVIPTGYHIQLNDLRAISVPFNFPPKDIDKALDELEGKTEDKPAKKKQKRKLKNDG